MLGSTPGNSELAHLGNGSGNLLGKMPLQPAPPSFLSSDSYPARVTQDPRRRLSLSLSHQTSSRGRKSRGRVGGDPSALPLKLPAATTGNSYGAGCLWPQERFVAGALRLSCPTEKQRVTTGETLVWAGGCRKSLSVETISGCFLALKPRFSKECG